MNSEGIARDDLLWSLGDAAIVGRFRKLDSCMLCRRRRVNEAGLCESCYALLDGAEFEAAREWIAGVRCL